MPLRKESLPLLLVDMLLVLLAWWAAFWLRFNLDIPPEFDALAVQHPGIRFQWVDVEDESDVVGDLDIETFPTLLIANEAGARFFSPLAPHIAVLDRLIGSQREQPGPLLGADVQTLWHAIQDKLA